jgi:hypothetical protein
VNPEQENQMETPTVTVADLDKLAEDIRAQNEKIEKMESELTVENKALQVLLTTASAHLKELDRENYKAPHGTIYSVKKWQYTLPKTQETKEAFYQWLRDRGIYEQFITVNHTSFSSLCEKERDALEKEGEFFNVPGVEQPKLYETTRFRKS